jgi:hypothetical protein
VRPSAGTRGGSPNSSAGADPPRVTESDVDGFYARFEEPTDEGEETIQPGAF